MKKFILLLGLIISMTISSMAFCFMQYDNILAENEFSQNITQAYKDYLNMSDEQKATVGAIPLEYEMEVPNDDEVTYFENSYGASSTDSYYCLRDELMINNENQTSYGLCWNYCSSKVLETAYAKKFNTYINVSEAWVAMATYTLTGVDYDKIGGAGTPYYFTSAIKAKGVMYESDLPTELLDGVDNLNYTKYINAYQNLANLDLAKSVYTTSFGISNVSHIKTHLVQHSALYLRIDASQLITVNNKQVLDGARSVQNGWHAVTIIGWDDNFKYNSASMPSKSYTGAWIVLNSWGNDWGTEDGIFYVGYDALTRYNSGDITGFKILDKNDNINTSAHNVDLLDMEVTAKSTGNDFTIYNKHAYGTKTKTSGTINQYNVFDVNKTVNLDFEIQLNAGEIEEDSIYIMRNGYDKTMSFDIVLEAVTNAELDYDYSLKVVSNSNDLLWGTYYIYISHSNGFTYKIPFVLVSGAEIASTIIPYTNRLNNSSSYIYSHYNNIDISDSNLSGSIQTEVATNEKVYVGFYVSSYSQITNITSNDVGVSYSIGDYWVEGKIDSYSTGYIFVSFAGSTLKEGLNEYTFKINTATGNFIEYNYKLYYQPESVLLKKSNVYVSYINDKAANEKDRIVSYDYLDSGNSITLENAVDGEKVFKGWYLESTFETLVTAISKSIVNISTGTNYAISNPKYVILYAKFENATDFIIDYSLNITESYYKTGYSKNYTSILNNLDTIPFTSYIKLVTEVQVNDFDTSLLTFKYEWSNGQIGKIYESEIPEISVGLNTLSCTVTAFRGKKECQTLTEGTNTVSFQFTVSAPTLSGSGKVGTTLKVQNFDIQDDLVVEYIWSKSGENPLEFTVFDNEESEYLIDATMADRNLKCQVKFYDAETNLLGSAETNAIPVTASKAKTIGLPIVGKALTVELDDNASMIYTYQWKYLEDNVSYDIEDATNSVYIVAEDMIDKKVFCQIIASDGNESYPIISSYIKIFLPKISGNLSYGETISIIDLSDDYLYTYSWENSRGEEKGTEQTFTITADLISTVLSCEITVFDIATQDRIDSITISTNALVARRSVTYTIDDKTSIYGQPMVEATGSITKGTIVNGDNLVIIPMYTERVSYPVNDYAIYCEIADNEFKNYYNVTFEGSRGTQGNYAVTKATMDLTGTKWVCQDESEYTNESFYFNEDTEQGVKLVGFPAIITPIYENNININAGSYIASVSFIYDTNNYFEPIFEDFNWKINKKIIYLDGAWYNNVKQYTDKLTYRKNGYELTVKQANGSLLPVGVEPVYIDNAKSDVGEYIAKVSFNYSESNEQNYNYRMNNVDDLSWGIVKAKVSAPIWTGYTDLYYNGIEKTIKITQFDSTIITITSKNGDWSATNAGTYTASFEIDYDNKNYEIYNLELSKTWTINKKLITATDLKWNYNKNNPFTYDGTAKSVELINLPSVGNVQITYKDNEFTNPNSPLTQTVYVAKVKEYTCDSNYEFIIPENLMECQWKINQLKCDLVLPVTDYKVYDGLQGEIDVRLDNFNANYNTDIQYEFSYYVLNGQNQLVKVDEWVEPNTYYVDVVMKDNSGIYETVTASTIYVVCPIVIKSSTGTVSDIIASTSSGFSIDSKIAKEDMAHLNSWITPKVQNDIILDSFKIILLTDSNITEDIQIKVKLPNMESIQDVKFYLLNLDNSKTQLQDFQIVDEYIVFSGSYDTITQSCFVIAKEDFTFIKLVPYIVIGVVAFILIIVIIVLIIVKHKKKKQKEKNNDGNDKNNKNIGNNNPMGGNMMRNSNMNSMTQNSATRTQNTNLTRNTSMNSMQQNRPGSSLTSNYNRK